MIGTIKNKALKQLWDKGELKGINTDHLKRIKTVLSMLDAAEDLSDLNVPGFYLHTLKGARPARHSLRISGNWRITFEWGKGIADQIDYEDYH